MFESVGWGEILVLALVGLFVLGPERLPGAIGWVASTLRTVRDYAVGARDQLRDELGPEFEDLRKPLEDLRKPLEDLRSVRNMDPRRAVRQHLFDPPVDGSWSGAPTPAAPDPAVAAATAAAAADTATSGVPAAGSGKLIKGRSAVPDKLVAGEAAPFDSDAT